MKKKKTIIIIDDHPLLREGLKAVIGRDKRYEVIGETGLGREGLKLIKRLKPDIVLIDISLPDMNGIDLLYQIRKKFPETKIMIVSMHSKIDYITESFKAGALGYLVKESAATSLIKGLDSVSQGEYFLDSSISKEVVKRLIEAPSIRKINDSGYNSLTPREQQILRLLAEGYSNSEIAKILSISRKTVENHRANIMNKLNLHSLMDLVKYAVKLGLIDIDLWKSEPVQKGFSNRFDKRD